mgnify:CR=1 FL=1
MDIEINVYAKVICWECDRALEAEVVRKGSEQTIIVKPCDYCIDEAVNVEKDQRDAEGK